MTPRSTDVAGVGAGNAALCAALAAADEGASVLAPERAPEALSGGDSRYLGPGWERNATGVGARATS